MTSSFVHGEAFGSDLIHRMRKTDFSIQPADAAEGGGKKSLPEAYQGYRVPLLRE
jgi:hypothetical protein